MIDRTKKLPARFYVNSTGRKPVREWILELPEADRHTVGKDIQKVEFGWPIGMIGITVTRPSFPFYGVAAFGFRPRLDGVTTRLSWRLTAPRKSGEPRGRPINSFRRNALNSGSSGITVTRPSFPFYGLVAFGFRPRLDG